MKLLDLAPIWLIYKRRRVGFIFRSPTNPKVCQTCFVESFQHFRGRKPCYPDKHFSADSQTGIITKCAPGVEHWQGCNPDHCWTVAGGIENADFATITVSPSLDGSRGGLWHGHIQNGQIVGGI